MIEGLTIRSAMVDDRDAILTVVREAFSNGGRDGHEEVNIVQDTWSLAASPDGFDVIAHDDAGGGVVGHVLAALGDLDGREVLAIAPLATAPSHHGQGVGRALMTELLRRAEAADFGLVVLLGDPAFYGRFGFEPSGPLDITYRPVGRDNPHFLVRRFAGYDPAYRGEFVYCWEARSSST